MENIKLSVNSICGDRIYTRDDGKVLFAEIARGLRSGDTAIVDFENREISSESFLDEAIIEHFLHPIAKNAVQKIILKNVSRPDQMLLKRIYDYRVRLERKQQRQASRKNNRKADHSVVADKPNLPQSD